MFFQRSVNALLKCPISDPETVIIRRYIFAGKMEI